jgi:hypothetical protein
MKLSRIAPFSDLELFLLCRSRQYGLSALTLPRGRRSGGGGHSALPHFVRVVVFFSLSLRHPSAGWGPQQPFCHVRPAQWIPAFAGMTGEKNSHPSDCEAGFALFIGRTALLAGFLPDANLAHRTFGALRAICIRASRRSPTLNYPPKRATARRRCCAAHAEVVTRSGNCRELR